MASPNKPQNPQSAEQIDSSSDTQGADAKNTQPELPQLPETIEPAKLMEDTLVNRIRFGVGRTLKRGAIISAVSLGAGMAGGAITEHGFKKGITDHLRPDPAEAARIEQNEKEELKKAEEKERSESANPSKFKKFWKKTVSDVKGMGEKLVNGSETLKKMAEGYRGMKTKVDTMYKEYLNREKYLSAADRLAFWVGFLSSFYLMMKVALYLLKKFGSKADPVQRVNTKAQADKLTELIAAQNRTTAFLRATLASGDEKLIKKVAEKVIDEIKPMIEGLNDATKAIDELERGENSGGAAAADEKSTIGSEARGTRTEDKLIIPVEVVDVPDNTGSVPLKKVG